MSDIAKRKIDNTPKTPKKQKNDSSEATTDLKESPFLPKDIWKIISRSIEIDDFLALEKVSLFFRHLLKEQKEERKNRYLLQNVIGITNENKIREILTELDNGASLIYWTAGEVHRLRDYSNILAGIHDFGSNDPFLFREWESFIEHLEEENEECGKCGSVYYSRGKHSCDQDYNNRKCRKCDSDLIEASTKLCSTHLTEGFKTSRLVRYNITRYYSDWNGQVSTVTELDDDTLDRFNDGFGDDCLRKEAAKLKLEIVKVLFAFDFHFMGILMFCFFVGRWLEEPKVAKRDIYTQYSDEEENELESLLEEDEESEEEDEEGEEE